MLDVSAARDIVLRYAHRLPATELPAALGLVLAAGVPADRDSPPFAKAMMDGFAVRAADGDAPRTIIEDVPAGTVPTKSVGPGQASRIFTGAPIPAGADAVVMVEKSTVENATVRTADPGLKPGQHVLPRGAEMTAGQVVLPAGTVLTPQALGLLAAVGRTTVSAYRAPVVAILATGNELVEADAPPGPGQIRNSNGPMLVALADGATPQYLGIAPDEPTALAALIRDGLKSDVLVLAGGVSAGGLDLVPGVLTALGAATHFHAVRMKPGKPLLFATVGNTLVFGLPGNPVSAFVGFHLFVKPALRVLGGHADPGPTIETRPLAEAFAADNNRPTYHPAKLVPGGVRPLPWFGSPDLRGILTADALVVLPPGAVSYAAGHLVEVVVLT